MVEVGASRELPAESLNALFKQLRFSREQITTYLAIISKIELETLQCGSKQLISGFPVLICSCTKPLLSQVLGCTKS